MSFTTTRHWPVPVRSGNWKFSAFGLGLVAIFLLVTLGALNREWQHAEDQAVVNSSNLARAAEEHVASTVRAIDQILLNIARDYRRDPERFDFHYWVENSGLILRPEATGLAIADDKGIVILNNSGTIGHNVADRPHFIVQRDRKVDGLFIGVPVVTRGAHRLSIPFTRRLERPDGSFAGVVAFSLDPHYFDDFYESIQVGDKGGIALIGMDGIIRSRLVGNDHAVGQSIGASELFKRLPTQPVGSYQVTYSTDHVERIISYRTVRGYPLIMNVGFSIEEVLGPYNKFRRQVLLGAAIVGSLAMVITMALIREIGRRQDSERLFGTVLEAAPATIQVKDKERRVRWANKAYLDLIWPAAAAPGSVEMIEAADREVLQTGRTVAGLSLHFLATEQRPERHFVLVKTPIFDTSGAVDQILTIGTDITKLRHAEREAAAAREAEHAAETARAEVGRLLSGMPTAVYRGTIDAGGHSTISFMSDNVAAITGRSFEDITGPAGWYDHLGPDSRPEIEAFFARVLTTGESQTEYCLPGPSRVWIRDRARVVARQGDSAEVIGNWTDISREHAITQKAMENAKLATLGELATGLAHELSQPIAVMSLAAENAEDSLSEGETGIGDARTRLARIVDQAQRAKNIVSHLKIFGRTDRGPMEPVCLVSAVDGALALVQGHLRNDGIAVETHLPRDLPLVRGRLVLIESVLVNLCVNARDAMRQVPVESRVLRIEASTRPQGRVELRVIDQGGGIPAAVMPRLFEPFFTTKSPGEGTGLGLSISHGMMQTMGGGLAVTNTGSGACFVLTLRAVVPEGQACLASSAGGAMTFVHHDA